MPLIEISLYTMLVYIMGDDRGSCCLLILNVRCEVVAGWERKAWDGTRKSWLEPVI